MSKPKTLLNYFKPTGEKSKKKEDVDDAEVVDVTEEVEVFNGRRPSRASANRARQAWNDHESPATSSDDEDDFRRNTRKRTRGSGQNSKRSKQTTLSNGNGKANNVKKRPKLDPEREAFLRSGVPDVIEKEKEKVRLSLENGKDSGEEKAGAEKRRVIDAETLAFLHSGVPDIVAKSKQTVEKKREEEDALFNMGFFPKISHTSTDCKEDMAHEEEIENISNIFPNRVPSLELLEFSFSSAASISEPGSISKCLSYQENGATIGLCCASNSVRVSLDYDEVHTRRSKKTAEEKEADSRPWIEAMKVANVKDLVVDTNGMNTLTRWLKQWRSDIKDDGGTSRKMEVKKKRGNSSDSDFITSDEEDSEMKKKSVLVTGPSGCGKTAAVYVLAKHLGFEVVEVNFSSKRSGKEVIQRVEEAVLSHRIKSSRNCLLLFKDIDLVHPDEDEGFCSAVAQLITTAVRPIVMTTCLPAYSPIDSKLDKKDPLRITFTFPKAKDITEKILKPILSTTKSIAKSNDESHVDQWLDSIVRHSGCDIRRSINQLQLLLTTRPLTPKTLSTDDIHLYSSAFLAHSVDFNFPRQDRQVVTSASNSQESGSSQEDEVNLHLSARKKRCLKQLDSLKENLEIFADLDWTSQPSSSKSTLSTNMFGDIDDASWQWNHVSGFKSSFFNRLSTRFGSNADSDDLKYVRELVLENDKEVDRGYEIEGLNDEMSQYCNIICGGGEWESYAAFRTIVKANKLDSVVRVQKRHGRMASYFNRLDRNIVDKISNTLDFQTQLDSVTIHV